MLEHSKTEAQCFGHLKARELSPKEVASISGGCGMESTVTADDSGIQIDELNDGYLITGDDGD